MKKINLILSFCFLFSCNSLFSQVIINEAKNKTITVEQNDLNLNGDYNFINDGDPLTSLYGENTHEEGPDETGHLIFYLDLGKEYTNPQVKINFTFSSSTVSNFELLWSTNTSTWNNYLQIESGQSNTFISLTGQVRYIKFNIINNPGDNINISEIELPITYPTGNWIKDGNNNIYYKEGIVGIGTNIFSQESNSQNIKLIVDGKISAEEVEVKAIAADFVFDENYKLKSLDEVEKYIKANKHLPEVAPASETIKGVNLGDFNQTLLQKVEELTLYIIELNKKLNAIQKENEGFKKVFNQ